MSVLRHGLLDGRAIALAAAGDGRLSGRLSGLGARVETLEPDPGLGEDEERIGEWARERAPLHALVYDARALPATEAVWAAVREVAVGALIPSELPTKVLLIAPPLEDGEQALTLQAALENLARTLSVEWARYDVTTVMLAPGPDGREDVLAEVVAFLCSPAGGYFSGCRLELR